ncbi:DegT/DnrJ/EryC1/StrS family aminotransferase [Bradyrhizobium sp. UFLA05-112]
MIPFLDLKAQARTIGPEIEAAIACAIASAQSARGLEVGVFEARFADYCSVRYCRAVNSGATALHLALLAAGVGPGDEVITVSMNSAAAAAAIVRRGATPIFVEVDPVTWTMDPASIEAAITPRTKAIVPAHLHGLMADMDRIMSMARRHGLIVIEDAAEAHGAEYKGRRAGSIGDLGCFSFYPDKNLGAYGEAGAVTTNHPEFARRISRLLDWKQGDNSDQVVPSSYDDRMDEIQAAVLNVKMNHIEFWTEARRSIAMQYDRVLSDRSLAHPQPSSHSRHVYHVYAVRFQCRDKVIEKLRDAGIGVGVHYAIPVHLQKKYVELGYRIGDLPVTERLGREFLSFPIYPELSPDRITSIAAELKTIAGSEAQVFRDDGAFQKKVVATRPNRLAAGEWC